MKLIKITILNFKNFGSKKDFVFDTGFNVLTSKNGQGKSTVLHAIRIACGAYFLAIPKVKKMHISPSEIRVIAAGRQLIPQKPVIVEAEGSFPNKSNRVVWKRQIQENSNSTTSSDADVGVIRRIGSDNYKKIIKEGVENVSLPVIAFYGTSRAHGAGRNIKSRIGRQIFTEGYQDWYEMKSNTFKYETWLGSYDILKKKTKNTPIQKRHSSKL